MRSKPVNVEPGKQGFQRTARVAVPPPAPAAQRSGTAATADAGMADPPGDYRDMYDQLDARQLLLPRNGLRRLTCACADYQRRRRCAHVNRDIAADPSASPGVLDRVARESEHDSSVLGLVAKHPTAYSGTLDHIAAVSDNPAVLTRVAAHPNASPETLSRLASSPSVPVRCWTAWHPSCPPEALDRLASDEDVNVRQGVADHPDASMVTLLRMGTRAERDPWVRTAATHNPRYPGDAERLRMAGSPDTDPAVLGLLRADSNQEVRQAAMARLASAVA